MRTIEDIILENDLRGIGALRSYLRKDYCSQAAAFTLDKPGLIFIATGFYIASTGCPETDGPPGAVAIGNALTTLGREVVYVTDHHAIPILYPFIGSCYVQDFPIEDHERSKTFAKDLLYKYKPNLIISIERCGMTRHGQYLNMRGVDISDNTAKLDYLFQEHIPTIGIGDGGNEIGMGNLAKHIPTIESLPLDPCITNTNHLVISSTSNWGGYGLVAAISKLVDRNLLPSSSQESKLISLMVDLGAVDGVAGKAQYSVDNLDLGATEKVLEELHKLISTAPM